MGQQKNTLEKQLSENQLFISKFKNKNSIALQDRDIQINNLNMINNENLISNRDQDDDGFTTESVNRKIGNTEGMLSKNSRMTKSMDVNLKLPDINNNFKMNNDISFGNKEINEVDYVEEKNKLKFKIKTPKNEYKIGNEEKFKKGSQSFSLNKFD